MILAIDPGSKKSAYVWYTSMSEPVCDWGWIDNHNLADVVSKAWCDRLAIEMVASYGMAVGRDVFDTCVWIGRFVQAFHGPHTKVFRRDIKLHLCGQPRAKDSNVRQALIDRYGSTKREAIGTKKEPGPLYGVSKHGWSALAVAVTYDETMRLEATA